MEIDIWVERTQAKRRSVAYDMDLVAFSGQADRQFRSHDTAASVSRVTDYTNFHHISSD